jgi:glutamine amidotransferase
MYFVHSFAAVAADSSNVTATAPYGDEAVVAAVGRGSLQATQFHPEKSGLCGLALLQRWLSSFH